LLVKGVYFSISLSAGRKKRINRHSALTFTGIAIDPSGNVWLANNWKEILLQWNPGGNSIAVMCWGRRSVENTADWAAGAFYSLISHVVV
jgi:hypothetical protein